MLIKKITRDYIIMDLLESDQCCRLIRQKVSSAQLQTKGPLLRYLFQFSRVTNDINFCRSRAIVNVISVTSNAH